MTISKLRVANAILVGNETYAYLTKETHDMTLDGVIIWVVCKRTGHKVFTSLFNVPYGEILETHDREPNSQGSVKKKNPKG